MPCTNVTEGFIDVLRNLLDILVKRRWTTVVAVTYIVSF
jgi:hypothetical protein